MDVIGDGWLDLNTSYCGTYVGLGFFVFCCCIVLGDRLEDDSWSVWSCVVVVLCKHYLLLALVDCCHGLYSLLQGRLYVSGLLGQRQNLSSFLVLLPSCSLCRVRRSVLGLAVSTCMYCGLITIGIMKKCF